MKHEAHHKSAPKGGNLHQNPPFIISLAMKKICIPFLQKNNIFLLFLYIIYKMYVTLKLDDSGSRIHSVPDGNEEIVTNQWYVVMPWKMVTRHGANLTLKEVVEEIKKREENKKLVCRFEAEHRDEIDEILGLIDCIDKGYVEERFPEIYKFGPERLGVHLKDKFILEKYNSSGCPIDRSYNQLDYFKKTIKAYQGRDSDAVKYAKKVEAFIDKPLNELELEDVRLARKKVKFPRKLDISVFYQLTGRLPHEGIEYNYEIFIIHF